MFALSPATGQAVLNRENDVATLDLQPVNDLTVRGQVLVRLRDHIVSGRLSPGQRLTEQDLAASLGVSRGPLREAIRELVEIGLVVSQPYKGLFVRSITRKDLEELYSLRTVLEQFAFRTCWERRTDAALADLSARNDALTRTIDASQDGLLAIDQELHLHNWCYELSGHALLQKSWERMRPNLKFYFSLHQHAHNRMGPLREAHDVYVRLASGDDLAAMLDHLHEHMRQGLEKTVAALPDET